MTIERVDVAAARAARRAGLEDAARAARYAALAAVATRCGARVLALGHQADDQAETVLLHLFRGAGLSGLGAMAPVRRAFRPPGVPPDEAPVLTLWRPLLGVPRAAIDDYCRRWGLAPAVDPTNADLALRRNAVRHDILPAIERHFPNARSPLARAARILADDDALLEELIDRRWPAVARHEGGIVIVDRSAFRAEHRAAQRRIVRRAWATLRGATAGLAAEPVEAAREALDAGRTGARLALPGGVALALDRDSGALGDAETLDDRLRARAGLPLLAPDRCIPLPAVGEIALGGGWAVRVGEGRAPAGGAPGPWVLHIPLDPGGVCGGVYWGRFEHNGAAGGAPAQPEGAELAWLLRTWLPGDRVRLPGGRGTKKLQDWFVDRRVPRYLRGRLVLLTCGEWVVWVAGLAAFPLPPPAAAAARWVRVQVLRDGARMV